MSNFDESKVKRDSDGKFAVKEGGDTPAEVNRADELAGQTKRRKSIDEKLGVEFKGVKGADSIEKLLTEKQGHVKGAFYHEKIGEIDILWGDPDPERGYGISHIIQRRDKAQKEGKGKVSGIDMVRRIPEIFESGTFNFNVTRKRFEVTSGNNLVVIAPNMEGDNSIKWILTSYELN